MGNFRDKNICAEKVSDDARFKLSYFITLDEAMVWVACAEAYRITDRAANVTIDAKNIEEIERFDRPAHVFGAPTLGRVIGGNTKSAVPEHDQFQ